MVASYIVVRCKTARRRHSVPTEASLRAKIVVGVDVLLSVRRAVQPPAASLHLYLFPVQLVLITVWSLRPGAVVDDLLRVRQQLTSDWIFFTTVVGRRKVSVRSVTQTRTQIVEHAQPTLSMIPPLPRVADPAATYRVHAQLLAHSDVRDRRAWLPVRMGKLRPTTRIATHQLDPSLVPSRSSGSSPGRRTPCRLGRRRVGG